MSLYRMSRKYNNGEYYFTTKLLKFSKTCEGKTKKIFKKVIIRYVNIYISL